MAVADAATKAGFNTFNHEALFDLIWAARRVTTGTPLASNRPPPPRHPIYPDRYRPSGVGDNTKRKRKPLEIKAPPGPKDSVKLQFHPIQPLMRKRPVKKVNEDNLIDLTSDTETEMDLTQTANSMAKRQKLARSQTSQNVAPTTSMPETRQIGSAPNKCVPTGANLIPLGTGNQSNTSFGNALPARPAPTAQVPTKEVDISKQLLLVKTKLQDARKNMNTCQATMKALFDKHYQCFDDDKVMISLQKLSNHMNGVFDNGRDGAVEVDKVVEWLTERKDNIL